MAEDIITVVNDIGKEEEMPGGIQFHNIHHESILFEFYADEVDYDDNSSDGIEDDKMY